MASRLRVGQAVVLTAALFALLAGPLVVRADSQAGTKTFLYTSTQWVRITSTVYFSVKSCPGMNDAVKFTSYQFTFQKPKTNQYGITRFADNAAALGPICGGGSSITPIHFWADERVQYTWNPGLNLYQSVPYQSGLTGFPWVVASDLTATGIHVGIKETYQPPPGSPPIVKRYCHKNILQGGSQEGCSRNPA